LGGSKAWSWRTDLFFAAERRPTLEKSNNELENFMPKTMINCPNCRQPISVEIEQLFDQGVDSSAKQRLLSGAFNLVQCPHCGYQGNLATPIVYHDPTKELLITFVPTEIALPRDEQERVIGSMINQVINNLPQEKRKAYLLQPQSSLTLQGLVEQILEKDGITHEMIEAQQKRLALIQRLMGVSQDVLEEITRQEDKLIDAEFFGLIRRLVEASMMSGDQESAQALADLQQKLMPITTFGRELQAQSKEVEAAMADLRAAGEGLTREKLLELVENAPNETRLNAYVSLARPAMDYNFFQMLSEKIDRARGDSRSRLVDLRTRLLELTSRIDKQMEERANSARQLLNEIIESDDVEEVLLANISSLDEFFIQELNSAMEAARGKGDLDRIGKLQKVVAVLEQMSSAPPEVALIEELLDAADEAELDKLLEEHQEEVTPEFISALANVMNQVEAGDDQEFAQKVRDVYRKALRSSMQKNFGG
jgi:hypothetical protein